ncbi:unnamed protein product [Blepharisma stoltei]|uniref:Uncharacterized protein n=1 Tax=Blepharisma stoltei TaxID=1481888 RepID=A0AAU9KI07_9CILI|nr:unnamed protein product [Blepharisma stoltei]
MWTKLAYLSPEAFYGNLVNGKWMRAALSARYRNVLRKEFLKAGVPWEYDPVKAPGRHPYDRAPKIPARYRNKAIRIEKISKALERQDELILKNREEMAKKKRLTGLDKFVSSTYNYWMKENKENQEKKDKQDKKPRGFK